MLPFFSNQGLALLRLLTDRGNEYCGKLANHAYQLYLSIAAIDHQEHGIGERFHSILKAEFYDRAFRKKIDSNLEELQADLDNWLAYYNKARPHSGKYCYGKTPMQTFLD